MYNGEIVSYEISERPVLTQVLSMLDKAFKNRPNSKGCILHSDQGWQYQHSTYRVIGQKVCVTNPNKLENL